MIVSGYDIFNANKINLPAGIRMKSNFLIQKYCKRSQTDLILSCRHIMAYGAPSIDYLQALRKERDKLDPFRSVIPLSCKLIDEGIEY
jgi:hypothetical protein